MSTDPLKKPTPDMPPNQTASQPHDEIEADHATEAAQDAAAPQHRDDLIAELRRDAAEFKDKYLRAHAEMENLRRRTEREKDDIGKYAVTKLARDLLGVGDNFHRALAAVPPGAADADPALKSLVDGVSMTEREFASVLEKHGVKKIEAQDQPFNPHLHQAVMELPNANVPAGTVIQVFQQGYIIEDRTLRPAMVAVSAGGPKAANPATSDAAPDTPPTA
jgi:molecular chaperone GrpE